LALMDAIAIAAACAATRAAAVGGKNEKNSTT
jgi:hypothetical protein